MLQILILKISFPTCSQACCRVLRMVLILPRLTVRMVLAKVDTMILQSAAGPMIRMALAAADIMTLQWVMAGTMILREVTMILIRMTGIEVGIIGMNIGNGLTSS